MTMPETIQSCPLCGSAQSTLFDRRQFRSETVTNRLCAGCGLVYQSPRRTDEELAAFYAAEYRKLYQGSEGPDQKDLAVQAGRAEALLDFIQPKVRAVSRHLDIGCSAGLLLQRLQKAYNGQAVGVEPGRAYRAYAQEAGLRVYPSLEELQACEEPPFDLVSLAHVLEHIADPVAYLAALRRDLLEPGGGLLVEVPNLYAHDSFEVAHLVAYSPHTLLQTLERAGFEAVAVTTHGQPRSGIIPLYLTVLASIAPGGKPYWIRPERAVRLKRRLGLLHRRILSRLLPGLAWKTPK